MMAMYQYAIALRDEKTGNVCGTVRIGAKQLELKYKAACKEDQGRRFLILADAMHDTWESYPLPDKLEGGVVITPKSGKRGDILYVVSTHGAQVHFLSYGKNCSQKVNMRKVRESIVRTLAVPEPSAAAKPLEKQIQRQEAKPAAPAPIKAKEPSVAEQVIAQIKPEVPAAPLPLAPEQAEERKAAPPFYTIEQLEQAFQKDSQALKKEICSKRPDELSACYDGLSIQGEVEKCQRQGCEFVQPFGEGWSGSFWKVQYPDNSWHYIVGRLLMEGEEVYALGIPGVESETPPPCLEEFDTFLPAENTNVPGYWMLFQKSRKTEANR